MLNIILLVLPLVVIFKQTSADLPEIVDWCQVEEELCEGLPHVACFDPATDEKFCPDVKLFKLSKENKQEIVDRYNFHRNRVANGEFLGIPYKAARMIKVQWDDTLEYLARVELQRCKSVDYCRAVSGRETIFAQQYSEWNYTKSIDLENVSFSTYDELFNGIITSEYNFFQNKISDSKVEIDRESGKVRVLNIDFQYWKFYLKNIDELSYRFGCAFALTPTWAGHDGSTTEVYSKYICQFLFIEEYNYNVLTYKIGSPCSECNSMGMNCSTDFSNLCEIAEEKNINENEIMKKSDGDLLHLQFFIISALFILIFSD